MFQYSNALCLFFVCSTTIRELYFCGASLVYFSRGRVRSIRPMTGSAKTKLKVKHPISKTQIGLDRRLIRGSHSKPSVDEKSSLFAACQGLVLSTYNTSLLQALCETSTKWKNGKPHCSSTKHELFRHPACCEHSSYLLRGLEKCPLDDLCLSLEGLVVVLYYCRDHGPHGVGRKSNSRTLSLPRYARRLVKIRSPFLLAAS